MGAINKDDPPEGRKAPQNKHHDSAADRAGKLVERFRALNTRHHTDLHSQLAEAAELQILFKNNIFEYKKFIDRFFSKYSNQRPKGHETSHDLIYCVTNANNREERRDAGRYVRVVEYLIAKKSKIGNFETYLNEHTYTGVLELARQDKRPAKIRDKRKYVKVYFDDVPKDFFKILAKSPHEVEFYLECTFSPGPDATVTGTPLYVSKLGQFKWTKKMSDALKPYHNETATAQQELLDEIEELPRKKGRRAR